MEVEAILDVIELHLFDEIPHDAARPGTVSIWRGVPENLPNMLQARFDPATLHKALRCAVNPGSKYLGIHNAID
ncbi:hypothetical protein AUV02_10535 [Micrococcus sp. CH3]|nr:hypothetical protein AUV02_10535 [Micrococcus sp. CH3]KYK08201.1 hypothetical protein AUV08_10380 [Micrococcus sp. CH7]